MNENIMLQADLEERDLLMIEINEMILSDVPNREIEKKISAVKRISKKVKQVQQALETIKNYGIEGE